MPASTLRRPDAATGGDEECRTEPVASSAAWATAALRRQEMPSEEVRIVLSTDDPGLVRRHLELHRERLEERLAEQRRTLAAVERLLVGLAVVRSGTGPGRSHGTC